MRAAGQRPVRRTGHNMFHHVSPWLMSSKCLGDFGPHSFDLRIFPIPPFKPFWQAGTAKSRRRGLGT
jgi:hypothetical protein